MFFYNSEARQERLFAQPGPPHDVNGKDAALMASKKIINEIADNRVWFVAELGYDAADEGIAAAVPLQIDRAVLVARTVNFCPAVRPARLFRPDFDKAELLLQLRIAHDLAAQRSAPGRDHMDHGLHL